MLLLRSHVRLMYPREGRELEMYNGRVLEHERKACDNTVIFLYHLKMS